MFLIDYFASIFPSSDTSLEDDAKPYPALLEAKDKLSQANPDYAFVASQLAPLGEVASNWLAKAVRIEATLHANSLFLQQGAHFLTRMAPLEHRWLPSLLPCSLHPQYTECIYSVLKEIPNLKHLYRSMRKVDNKHLGLASSERLILALFAALGIRDSCAYYKKTRFGLPRTVQWDCNARVMYIFSKSYVPTGIDRTHHKRVTGGMAVPFDQKRSIVPIAQSVNNHKTGASAKEMEVEVTLQARMHAINPEGIWPIWHFCSYIKNLGRKISSVAPFADGGTLHNFFENKKLGIGEHLEAIRQFCQGVSTVHSTGHIHGDLKSTNILFTLLPKLIVGLNDFGCCFATHETKNFPALFSEGFYGSIVPTAPEMLGVFPFKGDYKAAEMWAIGYMLFSYIFRKQPSWHADLITLSETTDTRQKQELHGRILKKMKTSIESEREQLLQYRSTPSSLLNLWICNLLCFDPRSRLTIDQALTQLNDIISLV